VTVTITVGGGPVGRSPSVHWRHQYYIGVFDEEEEEEEEDLFVFNDTIEGPRATAVKPGRVTQA